MSSRCQAGKSIQRTLQLGTHSPGKPEKKLRFELTRLVAQLPEMTYSTERMVRQEIGSEKLIKKSAIQLNSGVEVDGKMFRVIHIEHFTEVWASKKMLLEIVMTEQIRRIVSAALEHHPFCCRKP